MPKVSVVIPVYNVEPYIERCLHSLFNQTLKDIEYIFVNDCSSDASVSKIYDILSLYPNRNCQTKILNHTHNMGVAAARTTGIKAATGDYIIHCDPDDYIELDMYEKMYSRATDLDVDIVVCHFWLERCGHRELKTPFYDNTPQKCLKNMCKRKEQAGVRTIWNKLVRRELIFKYDIFPYKNIDYGEDFNCVVRFFYYAKSINVIKDPLYHYSQRYNSISASPINAKVLKMQICNIDLICQFLQQHNRGKYKEFCNHLKFLLKQEYKTFFNEKEREWFNLYRESHRDILTLASYPLKSRIILFVALQNYFLYKKIKSYISTI